MKGYTYFGDIKEFNRIKQLLVKEKKDFVILQSGSAKFIEFDGRKMKFMKDRPKEERLNVQSACRLVKIDAKSNAGSKRIPDVAIRTWEVNKDLLKEYEGKDVAGIDIRSCYWNIALRDGVISMETYLMFHEQKLERNMSIGNLARTMQVFIFQNGIMTDRQKFESDTKDSNRLIRYKTYQLYRQIQKATDNKVMLLKTDEILLPIPYAKKAKEVIQSNNLMATISLYYVENVDQRSFTLFSYKKQKSTKITSY
jgi:hypothetical protein